MEGNIAATYTLIYRFLKQQSQNKAAEAVKKAAKAIVVLRDDIEQDGPPLEDIIKEWKTKESPKSGDADSSSEDSDSSDDSSSDSDDNSSSDSSSEDTSGSKSEDDDTSDSDDSSDDSDKATTAKKLPQKAAERDTSVTLSSENVQEAPKQLAQIPKQKSTKDKNKGSESDSSDSDSSSDAESSSNSSNSSSSSDSSDEDEGNANDKGQSNKAKTTEDKNSSTSESSSESEDESDSDSQPKEDTRATKKRKTSESGAAVTTGSREIARASQSNEKPPPKVKERFQRVKVQNLAPDLLLNNGYEAKGGATNDYGERAHRDLIVTRGSGFRKEKNKKKRGSYRGGEITMESHSIKFDS